MRINVSVARYVESDLHNINSRNASIILAAKRTWASPNQCLLIQFIKIKARKIYEMMEYAEKM
jgi:hypothetical protein